MINADIMILAYPVIGGAVITSSTRRDSSPVPSAAKQ